MKRIQTTFMLASALLLAAGLTARAVQGADAGSGKPQMQQQVAPAKPAQNTADGEALQFNRLMKSKYTRNLPPPEDGIHDPTSEGTHRLQPPKEAFETMPKSRAGNYVDWVKSLKDGVIKPRYNRDDPKEEAVVFDLDIIREVKGSMPDVVYPHDRHTQWLDCSNCHPDIFIPEKGKNQISMAMIIMGQKCGVCHGKVAFPVSECRLCHSKKKDGAPGQAKTADAAAVAK